MTLKRDDAGVHDRGEGEGDAAPESAAPRCGVARGSAHAGARIATLWLPVVLWAAFIFFMSAHTGDDLSHGDGFFALVKQWLGGVQAALLGPDIDVVSSLGHFCEYLVLGALLTRAFGACRSRSFALVLGLAVLTASAYGVTDELHQIFVPGRMCDPADWLVDTVGAAVGAFVWMGFAGMRKRGAS